MKKKWICLFTALVLTAGVCTAEPIRSRATQRKTPVTESKESTTPKFDEEHDCTLTVHPEDPLKAEESRFGEDLMSADVTVDVYRIADAVKVPGYDSYKYQFTGAYKDLTLEMWTPSPDDPEQEEPTASSWKKLAQDAAKIALNTEEAAGEGVNIVGEGGGLVSTDAEGSGMKPGLYLLIARGAEYKTTPDYRVTMESKDEAVNGNIATIADSDQYTYIFSPELISLPMRDAEVRPDGEYMTSDNNLWVYDLDVYLKPARVQRYGPLRIRKNLSFYESEDDIYETEPVPEPVTFVFRAEWTLTKGEGTAAGEVTESRVGSLTFDSAEEQEIILERIPAGIDVTVTEEYSSISYDPAGPITHTERINADRIRNGRAVLGEDNQVRMIIPGEITDRDTPENPVTSVAFENQYNRRQTKGYGIRNHFDYDGNDWSWSNDQGQDRMPVGGSTETPSPEQPEGPGGDTEPPEQPEANE